MGYEIVPLCTGFINLDKGSHITQSRDFGVNILVPDIAWLVLGNGRNLLIDTGMCDTVRADKWHHKGSYQQPGQNIVEQLKKHGYSPSDIDVIIFTHLHWDHCSNLDYFTKSELIVHEDELIFATHPLPPYYRSYESVSIGLEPPFLEKRFRTIRGVVEIIDGITVIPTPGHSPGHISVMVKGTNVTFAIAGDAVFSYQNLESDWENGLPVLPIGRFVDAEKMWNSLLLLARCGAIVLPTHEERVLDVQKYC